mgnify:FL=1
MSGPAFHLLSDDDLATLEAFECSERLRSNIAMFARVKAERKARKEKLRAPERRAKTAERVRKHRTSSKSLNRQRLDTLKKATARASGDRFLEKLVGRERDLVRFWIILTDARKRFGPGASDRVIADHYRRFTGTPMDRNGAFRCRHIIQKLEAAGGVWHRLK